MTLTIINRRDNRELEIDPFYLSTEPKPTDNEKFTIKPGSRIMEVDTSKIFVWMPEEKTAGEWIEEIDGKPFFH